MSSIELNDFEKYKIEFNNTNFLFFEKYYQKELSLGFVQKIQLLNLEKTFLRLKIRQNKEMKDLIIGEGFTLITKLKTEAKENKGFALLLNNKLENKQIKNILQINLEKILKFEFLEYNLYCEFFSNNNIILTDKNDIILGCLIKEEWKDRKIAIKQKYVLPKNDFGNVLEYTPKKSDLDMKKNLISNIIKNVSVSPLLVEEIIKHKKLDKEKYSYKDFEIIIALLKKAYSNIDLEKTNYLIFKDKINFFCLDLNIFDFINVSLNDVFDNILFKKEIYSNDNYQLNTFEKEKKHLQGIIDQQVKAKQKIENKANMAKNNADFIYSNYEALEKLRTEYKKMSENKINIKEFEKYCEKINKTYNLKLNYKKEEKEKRKIIFSIE
jgi:predicted ribosome quality control (RQC) complex YloA/Tae2 family protein